MKSGRTRRTCGALALMSLLSASGTALAASSEDADWPCVQRRVPEVSAGMVWAGPPLEELQQDWRQDREVSQLAGKIAARRTELEAAKAAVADFAAGLGADRSEKLTLLFAGALSIVNKDRASILSGIERFTRKQRALAERIGETAAKLKALPADAAAQREELEQQRLWDTRIYEDRERSLTYICEQPVLLEQRIFALAREIMGLLE